MINVDILWIREWQFPSSSTHYWAHGPTWPHASVVVVANRPRAFGLKTIGNMWLHGFGGQKSPPQPKSNKISVFYTKPTPPNPWVVHLGHGFEQPPLPPEQDSVFKQWLWRQFTYHDQDVKSPQQTSKTWTKTHGYRMRIFPMKDNESSTLPPKKSRWNINMVNLIIQNHPLTSKEIMWKSPPKQP